MLTAALVLVAAAGLAAAGWWWRTAADRERRLRAALGELERLQHAFGRFAPAAVVDRIAAQGVSTAPETKEITVLFADLRDFTALTERMEAAQLVRILNGYLEAMSRAIDAHRGHVGKFIGDGILALFGALEPNPWQTDDAVAAALAMRAALAEYNARLAAEGQPALRNGIGIHRGPVVAGVLGTASLLEYGVIGATVNLAARTERLTRTHGADVLVTAAVRAHLDPRYRLQALPPVAVKGIAEPVATWAVEGFDGAGAPSEPKPFRGEPG